MQWRGYGWRRVKQLIPMKSWTPSAVIRANTRAKTDKFLVGHHASLKKFEPGKCVHTDLEGENGLNFINKLWSIRFTGNPQRPAQGPYPVELCFNSPCNAGMKFTEQTTQTCWPCAFSQLFDPSPRYGGKHPGYVVLFFWWKAPRGSMRTKTHRMHSVDSFLWKIRSKPNTWLPHFSPFLQFLHWQFPSSSASIYFTFLLCLTRVTAPPSQVKHRKDF